MTLRTRFILVLIAGSLLPITAGAADFYVSPTGNGNGSFNQPWSLPTALAQPAAVKPGDTIWLRGGTYSGAFTANLNGAPNAPIIVRQYPGERAILDGAADSLSSGLTISGSWTWYWGFEVTNSNTSRFLSTGVNRGGGIVMDATDSKIINMVIHDTGEGISFWTPAQNSELSGNLIYYNGFDLPDRGHGHGIYAQNATGTKNIDDNIIFDQYGWGIHVYTEGGSIDNFNIDGNVSFNNGSVSFSGYTNNILVGGLQLAHNNNITNNYTYYTPSVGTGYNNIGYVAGCANTTINNNYFASGYFAISLPNCVPTQMTGNTFYGTTPGWIAGAYPNNVITGSRPAGVKTYVRPNKYEPGRGNIAIFNWDLQSAVGVDLSPLGLTPGSSFEIRDAENYFGPPVVSGTYNGGLVYIPMTGLGKAVPVGNVDTVPHHTAPEFGAFVVLGRGSSSSDVTPPTVSITAPANGSVQSGTISLTASASDNVGVANVQFKIDNNSLGSPIATSPYTLTWDTTTVANGSHTLTATATDFAGNQASSSVTFTVTNTTSGGGGSFIPIRVRAGGPSYTDPILGNVWAADYGYTGGSAFSYVTPIANTTTQPLYQNERWSSTTLPYQFSVPNGIYSVTLKFDELFQTGPGQRVFNVVLNGQTVLSNFDIYAAAGGKFIALDKQFTTTVTNGLLNIQFVQITGAPKINAIQILQQSTSTPPVQITIAPGSASLNASGTQPFTAIVTGSSNTGVSWLLNPNVGTISAAGLYTAPASITTGQIVTVTAVSSADPTKSASATVSLQAPSSGGSAQFVRTDTTTQGNWKSAYGGDGFVIVNDGTQPPAYASITPSGASLWTWAASTTDIRGLQKAAVNDRIEATWYSSSTTFSVDLNLTDGNAHQVAFYCLDFENAGRAQTVDILDAQSGTVLNSQSLLAFHGGAYLVWTISGHVTVRFTRTAGNNAVTSGVFFGGPTAAISNAAQFVKLDTSTSGSWKGHYGAAGADVIGDTAVWPSYAPLVASGQSFWTWSSPATDLRAPLTNAGSSRVAATWYSGTTFNIDVRLTDGKTHQFSIYCVDWENAGRAQTLDVLDGDTGALLDTRTLSAFNNGQYLVWSISGHVNLRFTSTSAKNAVVSALFLE